MPNFNSKNVLYIAFFTSLISAIVMVSLFVFLKPENSLEKNPIAQKLKNFVLPEEEKVDTDVGILIMGYGGAGHSGGGLADANILIHLDNSIQKISLISIPRDLWVQMPIRSDIFENHKINAAFAIGNDDNRYGLKQSEFKGEHGGGNLAKHVVSKVVGLDVDYYAAIDFERFKSAIDALDGITVDVPVSFTDKYFPIKGNEELLCGFSPEKNAEVNEKYSGFELEKQFECRYETLEFKKGKTQMDGETALKFIRSRHSDNHGGDFARGERTQAVLIGIANKLIDLDAVNKIDDFYQQFSQMITTDINEDALLKLLTKYPNVASYNIQKLNINTDLVKGATSSDGQSILIPNAGDLDFSQIKNYIKMSTQ